MTADPCSGDSAGASDAPGHDGPPVIDAQCLLAPGNAGRPPPPAVAAAIAAAAARWGFFQLVNHGSDAALLRRMVAAMEAFFDLPLEDKLKVGRRGLHITTPAACVS